MIVPNISYSDLRLIYCIQLIEQMVNKLFKLKSFLTLPVSKMINEFSLDFTDILLRNIVRFDFDTFQQTLLFMTNKLISCKLVN